MASEFINNVQRLHFQPNKSRYIYQQRSCKNKLIITCKQHNKHNNGITISIDDHNIGVVLLFIELSEHTYRDVSSR